MNKYHSGEHDALKPPSPGVGSVKQPHSKGESTAAWPTSIGPKSKNVNGVGWPKVKHSVKTTI